MYWPELAGYLTAITDASFYKCNSFCGGLGEKENTALGSAVCIQRKDFCQLLNVLFGSGGGVDSVYGNP